MILSANDVILVTGGAGFLGQHIVKELLLETVVREVRVFDKRCVSTELIDEELRPYASRLVSVTGDVTDTDDVSAAVAGTSGVIHSAALVDFRMFPDHNALHSINVIGTRNVIQACVDNNVSRLLFTSTIDSVIGNEEIRDGDETLPYPHTCLIHGYGHSKQEAEKLVFSANNTPLPAGGGKVLRTVCLRPTVMYGTGDPYLIPTALESTKQIGTMVRVGNGKALSQYSYVGNVAHAHVMAISGLASESAEQLSGRSYFITDDTPLMNSFDFFELFWKPCGKTVTSRYIPYLMVYVVMFVVELVMSLMRVVSSVNSNHTLAAIIYVNRTLHFSRKNAEEALGYTPKFQFSSALENSLHFYANLQ